MPAAQRSHPDSLRSHRRAPGAPASGRAESLAPSVHDSPTNPFIRGLRDIFGRFADRPDFSALYESDLDRRLYRPWARVGDAMRLALGRPVTLVVTHLDGTRTADVIGPDPSSEEYLAAVRRAEETLPEPDEDFLAGEVVITATREEAARLVALVERNAGNVSERG